MDFSLSEEHKMVQDMARRFADQELKPIAARIDQEHRHDDGVL
ncbi:MAG: acyl-CoA dehydrogenase family protein, partial [Desulfomonilia bacterium]|nr:acyl-CoA dehydrogenase family protein [Desulfomonilia bacterium]